MIYWVVYGELLGYPECCIVDFLNRITKNIRIGKVKRKLHGTGYVPCENCNRKTEKELVNIINMNRKIDYLFPNCPDEFFNTLKIEVKNEISNK